MTGAERYELKYPVEIVVNRGKADERTETLSEVEIRRPKGRDMRLADERGGAASIQLKLIAQLTGLSQLHVDEMDAADLDAIGEIIDGFTPPGRQTGGTS